MHGFHLSLCYSFVCFASQSFTLLSDVGRSVFHHRVPALRSDDDRIQREYRRLCECEKTRKKTMNKLDNWIANYAKLTLWWRRDTPTYRIFQWFFAQVRLMVLWDRTPIRFSRIIESRKWWYWNDVPIRPPCSPMETRDDNCASLHPWQQSIRSNFQPDWFFCAKRSHVIFFFKLH